MTIIPDGDLQLMSGESLVLTCNVSIMDIVDDCVEVSARWLRVESGEEIRSAPPIEVHHDTTFKIEHAFESLSKENSGTYKCEANVTSKQAGLLATATESVNLNVTGKGVSKFAATYVYYHMYLTQLYRSCDLSLHSAANSWSH